ncbi:hypothetical protein [Methylocystis echinoides]|uniref:hypothetical protein n=1 Tax=Methylocystis echinoides TaxID=29468 RepID=UPI0024901BAE|nr:hypothetical protein [Methylocystis echinoides]
MHQGLEELIDNNLVDFRVFAVQFEINFLAGLPLELPHKTAHPLKDVANRNQTKLSGRLLHFPQHEFQSVRRFFEVAQIEINDIRAEERVGYAETELSDEIHQPAHLLSGDAQLTRGRPGGFADGGSVVCFAFRHDDLIPGELP